MKIGDRVMTEDGEGVIVDVEEYSRLKESRYGVKLEKKTKDRHYDMLYYWEKEIKKV